MLNRRMDSICVPLPKAKFLVDEQRYSDDFDYSMMELNRDEKTDSY